MAMDWKQNAFVGIGAVVVAVAGLAWLLAPPILDRREETKTQEVIRQSPEYQRWREYEDRAERYYSNQAPGR